MMGGIMLSLKNEIVKIAPRGRVNCISPGKLALGRTFRDLTESPYNFGVHCTGWTATPMALQALQNENIVYAALAS